jgi:hypothetical protein
MKRPGKPSSELRSMVKASEQRQEELRVSCGPWPLVAAGAVWVGIVPAQSSLSECQLSTSTSNAAARRITFTGVAGAEEGEATGGSNGQVVSPKAELDMEGAGNGQRMAVH